VRAAAARHAERSRTERPAGPREQTPPTYTLSSEKVAEIGKLLLTLAARTLTPRERTPSGYRLRLRPEPEVETALRDFVRRDNECCPFLDFSVKREPEALQLEVRGPEAANQLLDFCG
jgi:hypothetical protein